VTGRPVEDRSAKSSGADFNTSGEPPDVARKSIGWFFFAGIVVALMALVPPIGAWARHWVTAQAVQFSLLGFVVPPLVVLGLAPATRERLAAWPPLPVRGEPASRASRAALGTGGSERGSSDRFQDRPGRGIFDPAAARAWIVLAVFVGLLAVWRSPGVVDTLARREWLVLLEAATLIVSGCALWLNLMDSGASVKGAGRPRRMTIAALAMWSIWALAYMVGFSGHPMFPAFQHGPGAALSALDDQELAVGVLWAVPALAMMPVVFVNLVRWLRSQEIAPSERPKAGGREVP